MDLTNRATREPVIADDGIWVIGPLAVSALIATPSVSGPRHALGGSLPLPLHLFVSSPPPCPGLP